MDTRTTLAHSVPEAAARLNLSQPTLWRLIHDGILPSRRIGRRVLVLEEDLQELLRKGAPSRKRTPAEGVAA